MTSLLDFLLERLDEDRTAAQNASSKRVLTDVGAKGGIILQALQLPSQPCNTLLRLLAAPYSDHPQYDQRWADTLASG